MFFDRRSDADRDLRTLSTAAAGSADPIRGALAWVDGVAQLVVPGVGSFIAAGPIIAALHQARRSSPGVAIAQGLISLGFPAAVAGRYERRIKSDGSIMISIQTTNPYKIFRARTIFAESNAQEIYTSEIGARPAAAVAVSPATPVAPAMHATYGPLV